MFHTPFIQRPRSIGSAAIAAGVGGVPYVLAASGAAVSTTGDTNENILATVTIPAGAMGPNGILRVHSQWSYTNSANTKNIKVRLGGIGGTAFLNGGPTTTASQRDLRIIMNRNAQNSQIGGFGTTNAYVASASAVVTSAIDTSAATTLVFTGQNGLGSETITLESYMVELIKMS